MAGAYDDRDGKIWMDGKLVEWRDANVHLLVHNARNTAERLNEQPLTNTQHPCMRKQHRNDV